ncbi:MAG: YgiT-type zinc finger protein [Anaerolineales bacterium]|jgi:YgiT-type zinc finger domain-containing protein
MKPPSKDEPQQGSAYHCPECLAGVMRMEAVTYFTWLDEELVTVPNFPAWVCDMCGRREFDPRAITWLNTLLNPATGRKTNRKDRRPGRSAPRNQPQT